MPVELRPLPGVDVTGTGATLEAELRFASPQQLSRHNRAGSLTKTAGKKSLVAATFGHGDKRFVAPGNPQ